MARKDNASRSRDDAGECHVPSDISSLSGCPRDYLVRYRKKPCSVTDRAGPEQPENFRRSRKSGYLNKQLRDAVVPCADQVSFAHSEHLHRCMLPHMKPKGVTGHVSKPQ